VTLLFTAKYTLVGLEVASPEFLFILLLVDFIAVKVVPLTAMEEKFNFIKMSGQYFPSFMKLALRLQLLPGNVFKSSLVYWDLFSGWGVQGFPTSEVYSGTPLNRHH
jgi:hypothetical protein